MKIIRAPQKKAIVMIAFFSVFVNALMLTGPLFMLQIYDRVLSSGSEATLVALFLLVAFLFTAMAILDYVRGRIGARIGAEIQRVSDEEVFVASLRAKPNVKNESMTALADLDVIRRFFSAPVFFAIFDAPFTPLFIAAIFLFHPLLGWLAVAGALVLSAVSLTNQMASRGAIRTGARQAASASQFGELVRSAPETVRSLGMIEGLANRWSAQRKRAVEADLKLADLNGGFGSASKSFRLFLQSAMLALGAWLVLQEQMTSGAMIAASILLGRALAPIEQIISGWSMVARARQGWSSISRLLNATPPSPKRTRLNKPKARLTVDNLTVCAPGSSKPILRQLSFEIEPGTAIGVVGESAAGKSSLARVLTGLWLPAAGSVRLDGASLDQYGDEGLAEHVGYLPQEVALFDGTVAENIARMSTEPQHASIIRAAERAGAHEIILSLPNGYDSYIMDGGIALSGGQKQRIGLARALYGDPVLLVLDEPNSSLDTPGSNALNAAVHELKNDGHIVIVMAHRPAAIAECDMIMLLREGRLAAFGPRDEVLRGIVKNHTKVSNTIDLAQRAAKLGETP